MSISLLGKLEDLRTKVLSKSLSERQEALNDITNSLIILRPNDLSQLEVATLVEFYCARFLDNVVLFSGALKALLFLCSCKNFPSNAEQQVVLAMLKDQHVQSLSFEDRNAIFSILARLLSSRLEGLKALESEFVMLFVQAVDGERDPRNLTIIFYLHSFIADHFPLGPFADEYFDVVSCYFPIGFKPTANDNKAANTAALAALLRKCLTCSQAFGSPCMSLIMEHLQEEANSDGKAEALLLLESALDTFGAELFAEYALALWNDLRKQALVPKSSSLESNSLRCVCKLVSTVASCSENGGNSTLVVLLGQIMKDCDPFLCNPEMSLLLPSNQILLSAAEGGDIACLQLARKVLPILMEKYQAYTEFQKPYSDLLLSWLELLGKQPKICDTVIQSVIESLSALLTKFFEHQVDHIRCNAFKILKVLLECNSASDELCTQAVNIAVASVSLSDEAFESLHVLSEKKWSLLEAKVLPELFGKASTFGNKTVVDCLLAFTHDEKSFQLIIPSLLKSIQISCDRLLCLLNSLSNFLAKNGLRYVTNSRAGEWREKCYTELIAGLFAVTSQYLSSNGGDFIKLFEICHKCGVIAQEALLQLTESSAANIVKWCTDSVFLGKGSNFGYQRINMETGDRKVLLISAEHLLAAASSDTCNLVYSQILQEIWPILISDDIPADNDISICFHTSCCRLMANLINKANFGKEQQSHVEHIEQSLSQKLDNYIAGSSCSYSASKINMYILEWAWLTKAMLIRNLMPYCLRFLEKIISWLRYPTVAPFASAGLQIVLSDSAEILTERLHAKTTLLYKQRISNEVTSSLLKLFNLNDIGTKQYLFQVVGYLLSFAGSDQVGDLDLPKILPLVLQSVTSTDLMAVKYSLRSVKSLLPNPAVVDYFKSAEDEFGVFVDRLLESSRMNDKDMELRLLSLNCLQLIASHFPEGLLHKYKRRVAKTLQFALNDHKRLARLAAAAAINQWYVVA